MAPAREAIVTINMNRVFCPDSCQSKISRAKSALEGKAVDIYQLVLGMREEAQGLAWLGIRRHTVTKLRGR